MTHLIIDPASKSRYGRFVNAPEKCLDFIDYLLSNLPRSSDFILLEVETQKAMTLSQLRTVEARIREKLAKL